MPSSLEKVVSRTAASAKSAKAISQGLNGVFRRLMQEHDEVSALMRRVSTESEPETRAELYPTIRRELLAHERGELSEVYPLLAQRAETREIAAEHGQQAGDIERALNVVDALDLHTAAWGSAFERLCAVVRHHAEIEEKQYFPLAQRVLGDEVVEALESRYRAAKEAGLNRRG